MSYKARCAEIGDAYWIARKAHDTDLASMIWDSLETVEPDPMPVAELAKVAAWSKREGADATGESVWDAFTMRECLDVDKILTRILPDLKWQDAWCNGFRAGWLLPPAQGRAFAMILTFCEGDLTAQLFALPTADAAFHAAATSASAYYRRQQL